MTDWRAYVREHLPPFAGDARSESAVVDEIATQLQDVYDTAIRSGAPPDAADRVARAEVTDWTTLARDLECARAPLAVKARPLAQAGSRALGRLPFGVTLATFLHDMRHAARGLAAHPLFTATTLLTFALGIAATTVAYSLVHAVILSPLSYPEPERLTLVRQVVPEIAHQYPVVGVNPRSFLRWQQSCVTTCEGIAAFTPDGTTLTGQGEPEGLKGVRATPALFPLLGAFPLHGRLFDESHLVPGQDSGVLLSHGLWQRRFGSDPAIVGRTIQLSDVPHTVLGVLPPTFRFPQLAHLELSRLDPGAPDYVRPLAWGEERRKSWGEYDNLVLLRLERGVSIEAARSELTSLTTTEFKDAPIHPYPTIGRLDDAIASEARRPLWMLLGAVSTALLIACVNIANLLGARWMGRRRELAVRTAIGAGRGRLVSLVVAESLWLAGLGGLIGAIGAWLALDAIVARVPIDIPRLDDVTLDLPSLTLAAIVTTACGLACAVLPAWHAAGSYPADALKDGARSTTDGSRLTSLRAWLVGGEVALTTMLLVIGGLLLASFVNLLRVDPGFATTALVSAEVLLPSARYRDDAARARFQDQLLAALEDTPGIASASTTGRVPLEGDGSVDSIIRAGETRSIGEVPLGSHIVVSDSYFRTLGVPALHGRLPSPSDRERRVAVISERTARSIWGSAPAALGQTFTRSNKEVAWEVIGVIPDTRQWGIAREPGLIAYVPYRPQEASNSFAVVVRTRADVSTAAALSSIRSAVHALDPQLPLQRTQTIDDVVDRSLALRRFQLKLVAAFAGIGLLLACIGIYGVSAQAVERRRNELAIRLALGATPQRVRGLVVRQGLIPVAAGLALGLGLGVVVARGLATAFFGVTPSQPLIIAATALVVLGVALAACLEPASRAARTRLATALRSA